MKFSLTLLLSLLFLGAAAQNESPFVKFGKVSAADLQKKSYPIDAAANAVILADIGHYEIVGNNKGWFSVRMRRHKLVHILNKSGYDAATMFLNLYKNGDTEERLTSFKAVTYNLENDKVVESKLERSAIFTEKVNKNLSRLKYTFPAVKEGSIIEVDYEVLSDYYANLDPWIFQSDLPTLWSEITFTVPTFFTYTTLNRGHETISISDKKEQNSTFTIREGTSAFTNFSNLVNVYRWVMKDVRALKEEAFTSSVKNHIARMEFQLVSQHDPLQARTFRTSWQEINNNLQKSEYFGLALKPPYGWLDEIKPLVAGASTAEEKARSIFKHIQATYTNTGNPGYIYTDQSIKNLPKSKKGSSTEINLLLVAALRAAGLSADPVVLSTRNNGYAIEQLPLDSYFNHVVARVQLDGRSHFLDASDKLLGFNRLHASNYNGHARVVNDISEAVYLNPDTVKENKISIINLVNRAEGGWLGTMNQRPGYFESISIRQAVKDKGEEEYFKKVQKDFGSEIQLLSPVIDSLKNTDLPVFVNYSFNLDLDNEEVIYVNPVFGEGTKTNYFSAENRNYPVEMPYTIDETIVVTMEIPKGYVVDELPKQIINRFDEKGNTLFEYRIGHDGERISLKTRIKIGQATFIPADYAKLREFFSQIVAKHNEQIVLKKAKG